MSAAIADIRLRIEGMTCASCVARVEKALKRVAGVEDVAVNLATEEARIRGAAPSTALVAAVEDAGYGATLKQAGEQAVTAPADAEMLPLAVSIALSLPLVLHMVGL